MVPNRVKFFFAGPVLEMANPLIPGRPHERLAELVPSDSGRVLEICAGTGYLSRIVAHTHPDMEFQALDISPEMLAVGRRRAAKKGIERITFVRGDAGELPFEDDHFDLLLAAYGLHELPTEVRDRSAREAARVLHPGGHLMAVDIDSPSTRSRMFSAYMRWIEKPFAMDVVGEGLVNLLAGAGFTITRHDTVQTRPLPFQLIDAVMPTV